MPFTLGGFEKENLEEVIQRIIDNIKDSFPDLSIVPDNVVYQWIKAVAFEEYNIQTLIERALSNISVLSAEGEFLDRHAVEAGIFRKDPTYAYGYVKCTGYPSDLPVPAGTYFTTAGGRDYISIEQRSFDLYMAIKRAINTDVDYIPYPYSDITLSGLYSDSLLENLIGTGEYSFDNDAINWIGTGVVEGSIYYALLKDSEYMTVSTPIISVLEGGDGNTGPNTITKPKYAVQGIDYVTNPIGLYNGTNYETDSDLRYRILTAKRKTFSFGNIRRIISQTVGVADSSVYEGYSTDRTNVSGAVWSNAKNYTGNEYKHLSGEFGFSYYPSQFIGSLKSLKLYGHTKGTPPNLNVVMKYYESGQTGVMNIAEHVFRQDELQRDNFDEWQDIIIPLKTNYLDYTKTFRFHLNQDGADNDNCWVFASATDFPTGDYRRDYFSGAVSIAPTGLIYSTVYPTPSYNVGVIPLPGFDFENDLRNVIEEKLDYVDGDGNSPVGIQYVIEEATKVYLNLSTTLYLLEGYDFDYIESICISEVQRYISSLQPGDDIVYSQIEKAILNVEGVNKDVGLTLSINNGEETTNNSQKNITVNDDEYVVLDIEGIYSGVVITEG